MSREAEKFRTGLYHSEQGVITILYRPGLKWIQYVTVAPWTGVHKVAKAEARYIRPLILRSGTKAKQYPVKRLANRLKKSMREKRMKPTKTVREFLNAAAAQNIDVEETL